MELLSTFREDLTPQVQAQLIQNLVLEGTHLPKNLQSNLLNFPQLVKIEPIINPVKFVKNHLIKDDGPQAKQIFIFEPWQKGLKIKDLQWIAEDHCLVKVIFKNLYSIQIIVDLCVLDCEGAELEHYPTSFVVNKDTERSEILIKFKVKTPGKMNIKGVITKCCNVVCYHPINERGDSLHYIQTSGKNIQPQKDARGVIETFNLREVIVRDPYPSLQIEFLSAETGQLKVFNNSFDDLRITIQNKSQRAVEVFVARLRFEFLETSQDFEVTLGETDWKALAQLETLFIEINLFKPREKFLERSDKGYLVSISHLKNRMNLKKITMRYKYAFQASTPYLREDIISKEIFVNPAFSIENPLFSDSIKIQEIQSLNSKFDAKVISDHCYLTMDIINLTGITDPHLLNFRDKQTDKIIESARVSSDATQRVVLRLPKRASLQKDISLDSLLECTWENQIHLNKGFINFPTLSPKEFNILEKVPINILVQTNLHTYNEKDVFTKLGQFVEIQLQLSFDPEFETKKLMLISLVTEQTYSTLQHPVNSENVIYNGKNCFGLTVAKGSTSVTRTINFRLSQRGSFNLYCVLVDEQNSQASIFKFEKTIFAL